MKFVILFALIFSTLTSVNAKGNRPSAREVAEEYFTAFASLDSATMGGLYKNAQEGVFEDPIFDSLNTDQARAMWKMLLANPINYSVESEVVSAVGNEVVVNWVARYTFSMTNLPVENHGVSVLKVENGKIVKQEDKFDQCGWFKMAFPAPQAQAFCARPELFKNVIKAKLTQFMDAQAQN